MNKAVGIIGFGNMGSAIADAIKSDYRVSVFDKETSKLNGLSGIETVDSVAGLIEKSDAVILAVKPQDFDFVLMEIKNCGHLTDKLFISIAAGITTRYIENKLSVVRVVRAMPNMPARIGQGITCLSKGKFATDDDFDVTEDLFEYIGEVLEIKEEMMNAATAISGSGPGWFFDAVENCSGEYNTKHEDFIKNFIIELKEAARAVGFSDSDANTLSKTTVIASDALIKSYGNSDSAAALKKLVASKGGTTEAGLEVLHNNGSLMDAAKAAVKRAKELSKE
jgi:pyrroline-5-carboxylate reductase